MSRTWKKREGGRYFRHPKGRKCALINGVRKGAIPPDPWADVHLDSHCYIPNKVALGLHKKGWDNDRIVRHIRKKFSLTPREADVIMPSPYFPFWWKCKCEECTDVWERYKREHWGIRSVTLYESDSTDAA